MENIIKAIMNGCLCSKSTAQEYLDGELDNLCDLAELDDLRYDDLENACFSLGIESDYIEVLIEKIAGRGCHASFDTSFSFL